ncbi:MAG: hypothetical protein LBH59_02365, partial [Planctomycetaceae bacterium]|nr:hypothetical protein [Planctomycetaceae bacterium]
NQIIFNRHILKTNNKIHINKLTINLSKKYSLNTFTASREPPPNNNNKVYHNKYLLQVSQQ